jgi:hypothetical protein
LEGGLQPILRSLSHFFFTKINVFRLLNCKWHLLRFVSMLKKKNHFELNLWSYNVGPKTNSKKNMGSYFPHHWKGHLILMGSTWQHLKIVVIW